MPFNSYEELQAAVAERRQALLTIEVDLGGEYSVEHEEAKQALAQAKALQTMMGDAPFLAGQNLEELEAKVQATKPPTNSVWLQYRQLDLNDWAKVLNKPGMKTALEQYEEVLPQTFVGLYGQDPTAAGEGEVIEPLTRDGASVSSKGNKGILPGGALNSVVQNFMAWQNSGGEVSIRPTKSGQD